MDQARSLAHRTLRLLERFQRQRAAADRSLDALDATALELARSLAAEGLTLRQSAPFLSRDDRPITYAMVAKLLAGSVSRKPLVGNRRQGGERG